jgi:hypothetical protein
MTPLGRSIRPAFIFRDFVKRMPSASATAADHAKVLEQACGQTTTKLPVTPAEPAKR